MRKLILILFAAGAVAVAAAQQPAPPPAASASQAFEVATIKANKSGDFGQFIRRMPGGRITATNMALRPLITLSYQLAQFQLVGGPAWMTTDHFDIVAKMEGDPPPVPPGSGPDPMLLSLQALLADRFKLKVHRETREMDIYALVMAKPGGGPGPALKPSRTDCAAMAAARRNQPPQGPPPMPPPTGVIPCGIMGGPGSIRFGGFPISQLTQMLGNQTGRMVVDRTGLTGNWEFELTFAAEQRGQPPPGANIPAPDPDAPSIYTAIQEQLGLKLESTKGPVEVLVVDSAEHPTDD
jgi:uncharacterized protein (TIGR03435 family)